MAYSMTTSAEGSFADRSASNPELRRAPAYQILHVRFVAAWLVGIIVNLLMIPGFFDIALRDLGLALGALALARLGAQYGS